MWLFGACNRWACLLSGPPPLHSLLTIQRPQPPTGTHIPQGMLAGRRAAAEGPHPHPRKRAMEQFTAAASSWSSFLSGDKRRGLQASCCSRCSTRGLKPLFLWALRGFRSGPMAHYLRKAQKLSARATRGTTRAGARTLGRLLLPRFLPAWSFAPGRAGCA